jgi:hypothetical protein
MFVQDGFLYLKVTKHKLTVHDVDSEANYSLPLVLLVTLYGHMLTQ